MNRRLTISPLAAAAAIAATAAIAVFASAWQNTLVQSVGGALIGGAQAATTEELMEPGPLGEKTLGDPDAPNVVIEYASMTCSHCSAFHENTFDAFKEKYIDTGEVYFIFREFPLDPLATTAIMLARCAPDEQFFPLVDTLFEQQRNWAFVENPVVALFNIAKQAGFTEDSFRACLTNQELLDGVNWVKNRGAQDFAVNATPTFFFNGEKVSGDLSIEQVDELLAN